MFPLAPRFGMNDRGEQINADFSPGDAGMAPLGGAEADFQEDRVKRKAAALVPSPCQQSLSSAGYGAALSVGSRRPGSTRI
jgi:hypothetical protein